MRVQVGSYEVTGELGRGGMGVVYRATHVPTGATRALKLLPAGASAVAVQRFKREVEALARLGSSGVVSIHETGVTSGRAYYVMELMPGGSLRARIEKGAMPWQAAVGIALELARTLERCHGLGLVHRDLKPENVLFDDAGKPRLADFGCVKDLGAESLTKTGQMLGTILYMPPEQLGGRPTDARADVYALAVLLHELVAGEHPFRSNERMIDLLSAIARRSRPRLSVITDAPPALDGVIDRALEPDADDRTPSAAAFGAELADVLAGKEPVAHARVRRKRAGFFALAALLTAGAAALLGLKSRAPLEATLPPDFAAVSSRWAAAASVLAPADPADANAAALLATALAAQADDPATDLHAWETRARVAARTGRPFDAAPAAARALELLGRRDQERAHALREIRAVSLALLGRASELESGDPESAALAADALTDAGLWDELLALRSSDAHVQLRQAWARYKRGGTLESLEVELGKIHGLAPSERAAIEVLHARNELLRLASASHGIEAFEDRATGLLVKLKARLRVADPRLREPRRELEALEALMHSVGVGFTVASVDFLAALDDAALEAAEGGFTDEIEVIRILLLWKWKDEEKPERRRATIRWLDAAPRPPRYAAARLRIIAHDWEVVCIEYPAACEDLLRADEAVLAEPGDAGDALIDGKESVEPGLRARTSAAAAAALLALTRPEFLAVARKHLEAAENDKGVYGREGDLADIAVVHFLLAMADGGKDARRWAESEALKGGYEDAWLRGECDRRHGAFDQARGRLRNANPDVIPLRSSNRVIDATLKHDLPIVTDLATAADERMPVGDRVAARTRLGKASPRLPWVREDLAKLLGR